MSAGRKNRYRCESCEKSIITIDRDEGVTPFMLPCMRTEGCKGPMTSRFYVVEDIWPEPSYEWRKPTPKEYKRMSPAMKQHIDMGGLEIYPITPTKPATAQVRGMIEVDDSGYIYFRRADYLRRTGGLNREDFKRIGDGDILGRINPDAYKDIADAKEIATFLRGLAEQNSMRGAVRMFKSMHGTDSCWNCDSDYSQHNESYCPRS